MSLTSPGRELAIHVPWSVNTPVVAIEATVAARGMVHAMKTASPVVINENFHIIGLFAARKTWKNLCSALITHTVTDKSGML